MERVALETWRPPSQDCASKDLVDQIINLQYNIIGDHISRGIYAFFYQYDCIDYGNLEVMFYMTKKKWIFTDF